MNNNTNTNFSALRNTKNSVNSQITAHGIYDRINEDDSNVVLHRYEIRLKKIIKEERIVYLPRVKYSKNPNYEKLEKSHMVWINQNRPLGFGDAVKRVEKFVGKEDFILHAGDISIVSRFKHPVLRLIETAKKNPDVSAILVCKKVKDAKRYGILSNIQRLQGW